MPRPRAFSNAFTCQEVADLTGLTKPMVNYLAQSGFLEASYRPGSSKRGSTRYYSYRDLMVARVLSRLTAAGVELKRLKVALSDLQRSDLWERLKDRALPLLVTDGSSIFLEEPDGSVRDLTAKGQLTFSFVLDLARTESELRASMDEERRGNFTYDLHPPVERQAVSA